MRAQENGKHIQLFAEMKGTKRIVMKQILLTGGAGGLGRAVAQYFADRGATVFSCDIKEQKEYKRIVPIKLDLRDTRSIDAAREKVEAETMNLDAVIHLAGIYMMDSFAEMTEDRLSAIMDINFMGIYRVNKAFLPLLRGGGRIIITTSELAGQKPLPFTGVYAVSKTALECYADALRLELQLLGVPVITVRPGAFKTELLGQSSGEMLRFKENTEFYRGNLDRIAHIMEGQFGTAKDPEVLAKVFWKAAGSPHPKLRYTINANFLLKLYSVLPRRVQAFALRRILLRREQAE